MNTMHEARHTALRHTSTAKEKEDEKKNVLVLHVQIILAERMDEAFGRVKKKAKFYHIASFSSTYHVSLCVPFFDVI